MEELEKALLDVLNQSRLPLEAKRYILKHLYGTVDLNYQLTLEKTLNYQLTAEKAERESEGNDNRGSDKAD